MAASFDAQQSVSFSLFTEQGVKIPRLFNFDLPRLKQAGQAWPEQADVSSIHRVLDIASGTGEWAMLAAQAHPQVPIVGIEPDTQLVESARAQARTRGVENVSFTVMDPFEPLDLPDGTFDLVNARYIVGLLRADAWPRVLAELVRVSRPLLCITPMLKGLLQDAGCREVQQAVSVTNFSAGMPAHKELCQDFAQTYRLVQPFLISTGVTTQQEIEQVYQQMLSEMESERFRATGLSLTVWGTRP